MYTYNLNILIFSDDENLEKTILDIMPIEKFIYTVKRYEEVTSDIQLGDIIVWDLPYEQLLTLKKGLKNDAKIILCTSDYNNEYQIFDEIIIKPFDYNYTKYIMEKVFKNIKIEADLQYTKTCLNTTIDSIPGMIWFKTNEGIHTKLNKKFCEVVGKSREDITGKDHYYIWDVSKDDPNSGADICKKTEDEVVKAGHTLNFSESVKSQNGKMELITYKSPLYDKNGQVIGTVGYGEDVTELKNRYAINETLLNSVPYGILIQDNEGMITNVNRCFEEYFGISKKEIVGTSYSKWTKKTFHPDRKINKEGYTESKIYSSTGISKTFELRFNYIRDIFKDKTGKICFFRDVTIERELEERIIKTATEDSMTGLYNRRYLDEFISMQPKDKIINLFSIDLDHFKEINDNYGHQMGDKAIILTAKTIKACFPLDLVFRMGGDEFLVVKVGNYEMEELKEEAQELLDDISIKFSENNYFGNLSASIGIAQGSLENGIDKLYGQSDEALYKAKEEGRSCYRVYEEKRLKLIK